MTFSQKTKKDKKREEKKISSLNVQKVTEAGKHSHCHRCGEIVSLRRHKTSWNVKEMMTKSDRRMLENCCFFFFAVKSFFAAALKSCACLWVSEHFIKIDCEWSHSRSYTTELRLPSTWKQKRKVEEEKNHFFSPSEQVFNLASQTGSLSLQLSFDRRLMRTI